jgi:hypothetical protein
MSEERSPREPIWLRLSRYGWFAVVVAVLANKDACLGGGKRPDPVPPPAPSASPTATVAAPPATPPQPAATLMVPAQTAPPPPPTSAPPPPG